MSEEFIKLGYKVVSGEQIIIYLWLMFIKH